MWSMEKKNKKPLRITVSDVMLFISVINFLFVLSGIFLSAIGKR
uniref:Uncharacterized protein n=1 Tax=Dulem virus 35 TaxID=3145753 RepID=A0AAU8B094_9CAUD